MANVCENNNNNRNKIKRMKTILGKTIGAIQKVDVSRNSVNFSRNKKNDQFFFVKMFFILSRNKKLHIS